VRRRRLVDEPERVRQGLDRQDLQLAAHRLPGQVRGALAAAIEHEHGRALERRRQVGRCRVGHVVRHVGARAPDPGQAARYAGRAGPGAHRACATPPSPRR
jgi:hypothetical protein